MTKGEKERKLRVLYSCRWYSTHTIKIMKVIGEEGKGFKQATVNYSSAGRDRRKNVRWYLGRNTVQAYKGREQKLCEVYFSKCLTFWFYKVKTGGKKCDFINRKCDCNKNGCDFINKEWNWKNGAILSIIWKMKRKIMEKIRAKSERNFDVWLMWKKSRKKWKKLF